MFGFHPLNLAFRFLLEVAGLIGIAMGAQRLWSSWVVGVGLAFAALVAWGAFNVPGDKSRSGGAPFPVPGIVRLLLELAFFAGAVLLLGQRSTTLATILAGAVLVHYLFSIDRINWLLTN